MQDFKVVGIKEMYRNHPIPQIPNFKLVSWDDKLEIESADVYLQNNILGQKRRGLNKYYQYILDSNKPFLVVESAVFRRNMIQPPNLMAYHRYSWTSYYRDDGNYCNENSPSDRWLRIQKEQKIEIKDWRNNGEYVLLIMQRPGDSSLRKLMLQYTTYENFLTSIIKDIKKYTDRKIRIRLHPLRQDRQLEIINKLNLSGIEISTNMHGAGLLEGGGGLYKDFNNAWAVVGFNSNALTESICEGIPTFSLCTSSMAWDCSNKNLKDLENPIMFDRNQWLYNLGYCQWREDEIARGDPWFHLTKLKGKIINDSVV
jgi:hypothetical protein